jgi:aspartate aminotransferase-like enzyme
MSAGGHAYHSTMPTDALVVLRDRMIETRDFGFETAREKQWELGRKVRALLAANGFKSVAAPGFEAPGVVVSYTKDPTSRPAGSSWPKACRSPPASR